MVKEKEGSDEIFSGTKKTFSTTHDTARVALARYLRKDLF
jgi:hypothetical protein